jgi:uncharacterized membrane protein YhiD involved in acid resistance
MVARRQRLQSATVPLFLKTFMAAVGLAVGYGLYVLGTLCTLIMLGLLKAQYLPGWPGNGKDNEKQTVTVFRCRTMPERFRVLRRGNAQRKGTQQP